MDNDVLIISYDKGYGGEILVLLVARNTDKGLEIIKAFEREEAIKVYEMLSKWNKRFMEGLRWWLYLNEKQINVLSMLIKNG